MTAPSLSRQIAAVEAIIAILDGRKPRPKSPDQMTMLVDDAKAALATLRGLQP